MNTKFFIFILEKLWNFLGILRGDVEYIIEPTGQVHSVIKSVKRVNGVIEKLGFVSKQILYSRTTGFISNNIRLYRVEVINIDDESMESTVYVIPELCIGLFKNTKVPHVCAINCIIENIDN